VDPDGRSSVEYYRNQNLINVYDKNNNFLASFPAANNVDSRARGHFPLGTYNYAYSNLHKDEARPEGKYGSFGIFVFDVPNFSGLGLHSGRADKGGYKHPTMGCI